MGSVIWGFGFFWLLFWLLIFAVITIGEVYLFRNRTTASGSNQVVELLGEQYARGEISDEEFEERF